MSIPQEFTALRVSENSDGGFDRNLKRMKIADLPDNDVLVRVEWSSLNYKDALSASGNRGVTRRYPHTPGIDAAGVVLESRDEAWTAGDEVIVSCYDLGMNTPGGFGRMIRVPGKWIVRRPEGLSLREAMIYGTGGFTAAHCLHRLLELGLTPDAGPILVTGATGGVGSFAVAFLARAGFEVTAASGKPDAAAFLEELGAATVIGREKLKDNPGRAFLRPRWAGVVDTVGGEYLAAAVKSCRYGGIVTCCGNAAGADLPLTVYPFILKGITLAGVDSAECDIRKRKEIWQKLAGPWRPDNLERFATEIRLEELDETIGLMLAGRTRGRYVIKMTAP